MAGAPTHDSTQRFGDRAQAYARARPHYPDAVVTQLLQALDLAPGARVVDLGCGTGISSEPFLRAGLEVIGVEPNAAMREQAGALARRHAGFTLVDGRAEATGLAAHAADLAVAAQAFHWFDVPQARRECLRILRRPARVALLWNDRQEEGSAFATGYEALLRRHSADYLEIRHRHARLERVDEFFGPGAWQTLRARHADRLDFPALADRASSASYLPGPGTAGHGPLMAELEALFTRTARDGYVTMEFETRVLFGQITDPSAGFPPS